MTLRFYAVTEPWRAGIALHLADETEGGFYVAAPVALTSADRGVSQQPMLSIDMKAAQQLMDELWHCGLRPTEGSGSAGSLAATERHLEDMRRLVFTSPEK